MVRSIKCEVVTGKGLFWESHNQEGHCCPNTSQSKNGHDDVPTSGLRFCYWKELHEPILEYFKINIRLQVYQDKCWHLSVITERTQELCLTSQSLWWVTRYSDISSPTKSTQLSLPLPLKYRHTAAPKDVRLATRPQLTVPSSKMLWATALRNFTLSPLSST